ncbi:MAG: TatD family hydrolase [Pseudomonadota bacterium]|nr:hydrolase TatD [Pseudomonadales bacterium]MDY6918845.1 TatD family hydrolase [Pseudomonadota bacterium]
MPLELTDIGANLTDRSFSRDLDEVLHQARAAGTTRMLVTGTSLAESRAALALCREHGPGLWCTAGVHPHHAKDWDSNDYQQLTALTEDPLVVAVGETGLDYNRNFSPPAQQRFAFEQQLALAAETGLPLFLHERDAAGDQLRLLEHWRERISGGVIHCFTGDGETLRRYLALDLYVGITGWICDERRGLHLRQLVTSIPPQRLLVETDCPYLVPRTLRPRPRRNEPKYLTHINEQVAALLRVSPEQLAQQTSRNAATLLGLPPL